MKVKKILVSQPAPATEKSPYYDIAQKYGVEMIFRPFIKVEGLSAKDFRQQKINIADYTGIIFTSRVAVDNFFRLAEETRVTIPATLKYFCTTEAIALYLQKYIVYRKRKIFFGNTNKLDDPQLLQALTKNHKENMLMPVSDIHKETPDFEAIDKAGIKYTKAVMYRTVSNDFQPDEKLDYDLLLFFSPAGINSLIKNFPDFNQENNHVRIGAYGAATTDAARNAGIELAIAAPTPETPSMTAALEKYLKTQE